MKLWLVLGITLPQKGRLTKNELPRSPGVLKGPREAACPLVCPVAVGRAISRMYDRTLFTYAERIAMLRLIGTGVTS